jgi:hypothetical protein
MKSRSSFVIALAFALAGPAFTFADPITKEKTPEPLRPWMDWVLYGHEEELCPFLLGNADRRPCSWPSRLALDLGDRGGRFAQQWLVYRDAWVPLPGDARVWPQDVRVDGRPAIVAPQPGGPSVRLSAGRHGVAGSLEWDSLPPLLQVPMQTGLVGLSIRGRAVPFPARDEQGRLWLQKQPGREQAEDRLDITVHRKVTDEIPLLLTTRVELQVSGKGREAVLGRALPPRFVPTSLAGSLPARIDPDGRLRVQVRPGRFLLEVVARHEGPMASLPLPAPIGPWAADEVWAFESRPHLRIASVEGAPAVDPQQTTLPEEWKALPAYLMQAGKAMTLVEKRRGDSDPPPDQLSLSRSLWLDFHGGGYTIRDSIGGTLERSWRLEMAPPATLGRVAINGEDQFITRLGPDRPAGVELRQGQVSLEADSRIEGRVADIPAVGWGHDFTQVSAVLNLPPAWRLLHARGVDDVSATWISSWTLLDLFLVLISAMAAAKLWGRRWGAVALATLGLTWVEPGAPHWTWLAVLAGEALSRALPAGRIARFLRLAHRLALVALVVVAVPFLIRQVRGALYPALEQPFAYAQAAGSGGIGVVTGPTEYEGVGRAGERAREADQAMAPRMTSLGDLSAKVAAKPEEAEATAEAKSIVFAPDPKAVVQTGPGLPDWTWRAVSLGWRGPVKQSQRLRLVLVPPAANRLLSFARVGLVAILALCLFGFPERPWPGAFLQRIGLGRAVLPAAILVTLVAAAPRPGRASEIPPPEMLNELRSRLLAPPECRPNCASSPRLLLDASPASLRLRFEVDAAAETAVPLPGGVDQWLPDRVALDGEGTPGLVRGEDGRLWLRLGPGKHQVLMDGPLPDRSSVQIPLPLKPHRVTARARGWRVEGIHEDGLAEDNLQLVQVRARGQAGAATLEPGTLPPFVRVERELALGLKWQATTRVARVSPPGTAVVLEVPLLPGELVTAADVRVADGKALVSLGPLASQVTWVSSLEPRGTILLRAPEAVPWVEVWRLVAGPVWHVEAAGIPVIHLPDRSQDRMREWRPWPGESVEIEVSRPEGLSGQTLTIDRSALTLSPGLRATDAILDLTIRSSRGAQHVVTLPAGAELQSVAINGATQPIRQEGRDVTLPIAPAAQKARLAWRQNDGIRSFFRAPEVLLNAASVNARTRILMPADRWTLFLRGPRLGPAVLFWSLLAVSLLASTALGRAGLTPLRTRHWFLLSLGLTQAPLWIAIIIAAWLFGLGWRRDKGAGATPMGFNAVQVLMVILTLAALSGLFWSITQGLLGLPEMQISGNGSSASDLQWYMDRAGDVLPRPWVLSVPLMLYRLAMLAWALWLAQALLRWLKWGWGCFTEGGVWRPIRKMRPPLAPAAPGA